MALVLIFCFVPETKQLTLEELDREFLRPHETPEELIGRGVLDSDQGVHPLRDQSLATLGRKAILLDAEEHSYASFTPEEGRSNVLDTKERLARRALTWPAAIQR